MSNQELLAQALWYNSNAGKASLDKWEDLAQGTQNGFMLEAKCIIEWLGEKGLAITVKVH